MSAFDVVAANGILEPIDLHFARLMARRAAGAEADVVAVTAALLSRQRGRGHSCIDLRDWAGRPFPAAGGAPLPALPELATWRRTLAGSGLVSDGADPAPLVLDAAGRLYLARYWHAEQRLAANLRARLESAPPAVDPRALSPLFRRLFPDAVRSPGSTDDQAVAAATALAGRVTLISGGPGTGKTTTVGRLLALLAAAEPQLRVALAAPTGKAAARLGEAVAEHAARLPISEAARARLPANASTLHRLLAYQPRRDRFGHRAGRPLAADALVIDEVSMVDLLLMDAALDALPPGARVVLLGDKDQLTSVETGSVFGDLCAAAGLGGAAPGPTRDRAMQALPGRSSRFVNFFETLSGHRLAPREPPPLAVPPGLLDDSGVELTTNFRFRDRPGIAELANAIRRGDAGGAFAVLEDPDRTEASRLEPPAEDGAALAPVAGAIDAYLAADSPAEALERLGGFRVLCARRGGDWGVERLNAAVERRLAAGGHPVGEGSPRRGASGTFYPARPILITANDYQVQLFNGDLGICWPEAPGGLWAFFPGAGEGPRRLPLARLPPHETAWAMTVHKSQGSEFDRVLLVLGDADSRVMSRDLLYTGATRARRSVVVVASESVFRGAVARRSRRVSGLADALRGKPAEAPERSPTPPPGPSKPETEKETETPDGGGSGQLSLFG